MKLITIILIALALSGCYKKRIVTRTIEHKVPFIVNPQIRETITNTTLKNIEYLEKKHDQVLKPEFKEDLKQELDRGIDSILVTVPLFQDTITWDFNKKEVSGTVSVWQVGNQLEFDITIDCKCKEPTLFKKLLDSFPYILTIAIIISVIIFIRRILP